MVTLIQLEYIIAVDTHRHFAKAAQKCFVTQPTLSMQIKKLEEHLGVVVFDRSKQPVMPTIVGKKIIEQARIILRESDKIPQIIKSFDDFVSGHLVIGVIPSLASFLATQILGKFTKKYPGISIHIKELKTKDLVKELKKDLIDLGISAAPVSEDSLTVKTLFFEEILLYTNENLSSFGNQSKKTNLDIAGLQLLINSHESKQHASQLSTYFKNINGKSYFKYEGDSLETLKLLVEKEGGFTFIPEMASYANSKNEKAKYIRLEEIKPLREIVIIGNKQNPREQLADLLSKHIKKNIAPTLLDSKRGKVIDLPYE